MPEEESTDQQQPKSQTEETEEETAETAEGQVRGGADGKAKALGFQGIGDYGRPSRRTEAEEFNAEASPEKGI